MKLPRRQLLHLAASAAALLTVARIAWAQAYPARPVRLIVPIAPAGAGDILARLMGQWLSERLGQPFIIENRPGGGNNIGTEAVVRAPADGYTLLLAGTPFRLPLAANSSRTKGAPAAWRGSRLETVRALVI
jgi:tripartite-type tricarboxylate transporter receptor subunit TctC